MTAVNAFVRTRVNKASDGTVSIGRQATFVTQVVLAIPYSIRHYRAEIFRHIKDIAWGGGALIVGGGTVGIMVLLSLSAGTSLGIEGFTGLELLGLSPITGFLSATSNTREFAPIVAALAFGGQVGCRFTAQLGSMKIHEEIDALEVMGINAIKYLVTTRVVASMISIIPLHLIGMIGAYLSTEITVVGLFGQPRGTYEHYFNSFISGKDIMLSVVKIVIFAFAMCLIHCWFAFNAGGGPQGVGEATGKAIRASIVIVVVLDMFMTLAFWGNDPGVRIAG
jgi:phospholipid/cholesterol/gamma-HCH transport system permease protein